MGSESHVVKESPSNKKRADGTDRPTNVQLSENSNVRVGGSMHRRLDNSQVQSNLDLKLKAKRRSKAEMDGYRKELQIDDHLVSVSELEDRYGTNQKKGLDNARALELLRLYGRNALVPEKQRSRWLIFIEYMFGGFSLLLWIGALFSFSGYIIKYIRDPESPYDEIYLGIVLIFVVVVTGIFGFYQETSNQSIMESFKKMIPKSAAVIRNGKETLIDSEVLVVGDLVILTGGGCVPADVRLITVNALKVDNSSITGESDPQPRTTESKEKNPLEATNLAFYGTNVIEGSGMGFVIATADNTLMGKIAGLASGLQAAETPIKRELKHFVKLVTILSVAIGAGFFVISIAMNYPFFDSFLYSIAIIVANVPEGLLVTLTASLTLTARKMAKKNCMVKHLDCIETLGSTNVICSDKTGTLTQNRMTVSHMYFDGSIVDVLSSSYDAKGATPTFNTLCRVGLLCNKAYFQADQSKVAVQQKQIKGDASESAVLKCVEELIGNSMERRAKAPKVCEIPFNSTNKYQLSIHRLHDSPDYLMVMKGAPERILDRCDTLLSNGAELPIDDQIKKKLKMAVLELGYMGERVLGFADLSLKASKFPDNYQFNGDDPNFPMTGLRFVGLMSMIDPPRPGVPQAVAKCKTAGIRVVMVTGDHPITAMAIAKKVGIISAENETVYDIAMRRNVSASAVAQDDANRCVATIITGGDLRDMQEGDLDNVIDRYEEMVFARTSPQQKLQIVEAYQRKGLIVAVTGDGVNDSPALKKADIGIAMGISGSEVSKEAADMILLDDNFASIVTGIEEGRLIFDNLKKGIAYMLTSNVPEVVPFILFIVLNIPNPMSIMAILVIDVGTDLWPGISLAYEQAEADIMSRKPRRPKKDTLVNNRLICFTYLNIGVIQTFAGLTSYFFVMARYGFLPERLIGIQKEWDLQHNNDLLDSFGQEWSYDERKTLRAKSISAYFLAIVLTQIADCFICKTRRLSIIHQGMTNKVMNYGLMFEVAVAMFVVYCPVVNRMLEFESVDLYVICPAIPFVVLIIIYDEARKYLLRRSPGGWVDRETYF